MSTEIKVENEKDYYEKVVIEFKSKKDISTEDAKTFHEAANTILEMAEKYLNPADD